MTDIAYQNKDITAKYLGENLKEKSFSAYGLEIPKIRKVLPTKQQSKILKLSDPHD